MNECKNEQRMDKKEAAGCLTLSNPVMTETGKSHPPRGALCLNPRSHDAVCERQAGPWQRHARAFGTMARAL